MRNCNANLYFSVHHIFIFFSFLLEVKIYKLKLNKFISGFFKINILSTGSSNEFLSSKEGVNYFYVNTDCLVEFSSRRVQSPKEVDYPP